MLLTEHLSRGSPAGGPWDVLLFSGGGNDIVDNPMALWIRDWNPVVPAAEHIHQTRFDAALALVRAGYEDLIALRNDLSPGTHLVFQGYDFAMPDGRGVLRLRPVAQADLRSTQLSDADRETGGRKGHAAAIRDHADVFGGIAERHVHQWPGHAGSADKLVAQRASSVAGRLWGICGHLPSETSRTLPGPRGVADTAFGAGAPPRRTVPWLTEQSFRMRWRKREPGDKD